MEAPLRRVASAENLHRSPSPSRRTSSPQVPLGSSPSRPSILRLAVDRPSFDRILSDQVPPRSSSPSDIRSSPAPPTMDFPGSDCEEHNREDHIAADQRLPSPLASPIRRGDTASNDSSPAASPRQARKALLPSTPPTDRTHWLTPSISRRSRASASVSQTNDVCKGERSLLGHQIYAAKQLCACKSVSNYVMYACMYVYMYVYMYGCMYVCMYMCTCMGLYM